MTPLSPVFLLAPRPNVTVRSSSGGVAASVAGGKRPFAVISFRPFTVFVPVSAARKQEIIKITEQLIEAINNGDFEAYT